MYTTLLQYMHVSTSIVGIMGDIHLCTGSSHELVNL